MFETKIAANNSALSHTPNQFSLLSNHFNIIKDLTRPWKSIAHQQPFQSKN